MQSAASRRARERMAEQTSSDGSHAGGGDDRRQIELDEIVEVQSSRPARSSDLPFRENRDEHVEASGASSRANDPSRRAPK